MLTVIRCRIFWLPVCYPKSSYKVFKKYITIILREELRLRVFENMVLRRIFRPKRDEIKGKWGKLHNEKLNDLYSPSNIICIIKSRRIKWAGHVASIEEMRGADWVLVGKPNGKRQIGRPRLRWEDNIKLDLQDVGWKGIDWIDLS
jgi:hypothetical protein